MLENMVIQIVRWVTSVFGPANEDVSTVTWISLVSSDKGNLGKVKVLQFCVGCTLNDLNESFMPVMFEESCYTWRALLDFKLLCGWYACVVSNSNLCTYFIEFLLSFTFWLFPPSAAYSGGWNSLNCDDWPGSNKWDVMHFLRLRRMSYHWLVIEMCRRIQVWNWINVLILLCLVRRLWPNFWIDDLVCGLRQWEVVYDYTEGQEHVEVQLQTKTDIWSASR